jgi:DNA-binding PadR family transcriptional regulator
VEAGFATSQEIAGQKTFKITPQGTKEYRRLTEEAEIIKEAERQKKAAEEAQETSK